MCSVNQSSSDHRDMSAILELDCGPITHKDATDSEDNISNKLAYFRKTKNLLNDLWEHRRSIEALTAHHLGLGQDETCIVQDQCSWVRGSFNVCIPVEVTFRDGIRKVILRCPIPHKLAEPRYAGTIDEKISCEIGTYAWMQKNCHDVPIPHLFGFGFVDGRHISLIPPKDTAIIVRVG
ncbi:hypothetical protein J1614_006595 [Plenodomus biglobosus]|nr:hypothetical protein J1614_006595 [Plenodomus biglobosus]